MSGTVIFAHGKESGPWGTKIQALAAVAKQKGFAVESPDDSDTVDPEARVRRLLSCAPKASTPLVLVGSSMGGYVATVASATLHPSGLFLMAPAFYLPGYAEQNPHPPDCPTVVVHSWNDAVVPVDNAIRFARRHRLELHLLDDDHRLAGRLGRLQDFFGSLLDLVRQA